MTSAHRPALLLIALVALGALGACATSQARPRPDDDGRDRDAAAVIRDRRERETPSREVDGAAYPVGWERRSEAPNVRVWLDDAGDTFRAGDRVRALFRVQDDAYVTVVRIDTDGRLRVLYPRAPYQDNWVRGGHSYRVPGASGSTFTVDDPTGLGYVFAITSYEPFDFSRVSYGRGWDYQAIGDRVRGDPFLAVRRFADRIAFDDRTGYATAYDEYYVGRHVEYPRYACYDCHTAGTYPVYDPYGRHGHTVIVYDDPYYYPYRYYPGTRVVYAARPRYEFKPPATGGSPNAGAPAGGASTPVVEHRRRTEDVDLRRPGSPTSDPNLGSRRPADAGPGPGATRPGDEVYAPQPSGRRRVDDVTSSAPAAPARPGLGTPRREPQPDHGGTTPVPPSTGTGAGGDDDRPGDGHGRGPRREPPGQSGSGNGSGRGDGDGRGNGDHGVGDGHGSDSGPGNGVGRRDAGRNDGPPPAGRDAPPRRNDERDESPSGWRSGGSSERRGEPRAETTPARSEPQRSEPQRVERRSDRREEPRSEPKRESSSGSDSKRDDGRGPVPRRRSP